MLAVGGEAVGALLGLGGGVFLLRVFTWRETPLAGYVEREGWQRGEDTGRFGRQPRAEVGGLDKCMFAIHSDGVKSACFIEMHHHPAVSFNSGLRSLVRRLCHAAHTRLGM